MTYKAAVFFMLLALPCPLFKSFLRSCPVDVRLLLTFYSYNMQVPNHDKTNNQQQLPTSCTQPPPIHTEQQHRGSDQCTEHSGTSNSTSTTSTDGPTTSNPPATSLRATTNDASQGPPEPAYPAASHHNHAMHALTSTVEATMHSPSGPVDEIMQGVPQEDIPHAVTSGKSGRRDVGQNKGSAPLVADQSQQVCLDKDNCLNSFIKVCATVDGLKHEWFQSQQHSSFAHMILGACLLDVKAAYMT
jgi:hypothetical protein